MELFLAYVIGIISSLSATALLSRSARQRMKTIAKFPLSMALYILELEAKIKDMPFIYKDVDGDVINDFVDVDIKNVDPQTLQVTQASRILDITQDQRIRDAKKLILLGNAGIGKTTFQRHVILMLIHDKIRVRFFYDQERLVPFYVPLKAVDNVEPFPILRYLKKTTGWGTKRFERLAEEGRLFLLLDGYDEISFANPDKAAENHVRHELNMMMAPGKLLRKLSEAEQQAEDHGRPGAEGQASISFYLSLDNCRIWLSSRREFFEKHPIAPGDLRADDGWLSSLKAVELTGVGNNRLKLIKKIFDKYRLRAPIYAELLNEEYFLQEIDSGDDELRKLSYNPLFLTIMSYIYVRKAIESRDFRVSPTESFYDLIIECINLLLHDLDDWKARDLPPAYREALRRRRNSYLEEKKAFLPFFAVSLFLEERTLFDIEYLKDKIRQFFATEHDSPNGARIIAELADNRASYPNFALQLIFAGVFIIVDRSKSGVLYDFPHRRFREVLACEFAASPEHYELLLIHLNRSHLSELLRVFVQSPVFQNEALHDKTLRKVLADALHDGRCDDHHLRASRNFMKIKPDFYRHVPAVREFIINSLELDTPSFRVSKELLRDFQPEDELLDKVARVATEALDRAMPNRLSLCCALLEFFNRVYLRKLLADAFPLARERWSTLPALLQYYLPLCPDAALSWWHQVRPDERFVLQVSYVLAVVPVDPQIAATFVDELSDREQLQLLYLAWRHGRTRYDKMRALSRSKTPVELFDCIENNIQIGRVPEKSGVYHIVTDRMLRSLKSMELPNFLVKIEHQQTTVRVKRKDDKAAQDILTVVEKRHYATVNMEDIRGDIGRELEKIVHFPFPSRSGFDDRIRQIVWRPVGDLLARLKFEPADEAPYLQRGDTGREMTVEELNEDFKRHIQQHLTIDGESYRQIADLVVDLDSRFAPLKLVRFFE